MTSQFSLAHLTVNGAAPPEQIHIAARTGYEFVSLRPINMGLPGEPNFSLAQNKELMRRTKSALGETGVKLLDIEVIRIYDGVDLKDYLPDMEIAAELGGRHLLCSIWTIRRDYYLESFAELCDLAAKLGLTVDLEFVPIAGVSDLAGALEVLRTVKRDNAGLMVDVHHFHRSREKVEQLDAVPRKWFNFLHLCSAPESIPHSKEEMTRILREERLYVGEEGGIDVASIVNRIPEIPYSIELPNKKRCKELGYEEFARRCLNTARNYLNAIPQR